jgi:transposase
MARKRRKELSMRKIREILRLSMQCNIGNRDIARSLCISHTVVNEYLRRCREAGLRDYSPIEKINDEDLKKIIKRAPEVIPGGSRSQPDWNYIHQELRKKGVTLQLLWEEYKAMCPDGYQSTQFNEHYNRWKKKLTVSMRQTHKAGEKMFPDYAGQTVPIINRNTGEIREAQLFVGVLGASNYTFAEATWTQSLPDWINSHVRAFEYFGGVSKIVVPDNLKAGVTKSCRYEPDINPTYHDMAVHYGTVIIPTRVRKPKDKAKVEVGVQIAERWILAALRNRTFFSLGELNEAIGELLDKLNHRPFKKLNGSRHSWFEAMERSALLPLPQFRYVFAEWKKALVNIDYHIEIKNHYYSVPYALVQEKVELRYTSTTVEIFYKGKRVASHKRNDTPGKHTTVEEHMPKSHREYLKWSPSRIIRWAGKTGESTAQVVETILKTRRHPEQGYRSCMGIMRLGKQFSDSRLEAACRRAVAIGGLSYKSIRSILEKGLDRAPLANPDPQLRIEHPNIRGSHYFN